MKRLICVTLIGVLISLLLSDHIAARESITTILKMRDSAGDSAQATFGVATGATYCIDSAFGETELPPLPPLGFIDLRLTNHRTGETCLGEGLALHLQEWEYPAGSDTFRIAFRPGSGDYPLTFSWRSDLASSWSALRLIDRIGGSVIDIDMLAETTAVLSDNLISSLHIIGTPRTAPPLFIPDTPVLLLPPDDATAIIPQPTLTWQNSLSASTYHLQVSLSNLFETMVYEDSTLTGLSSQVGPLNANETYHWRVRATNGAGSSGFSFPRQFTTGDVEPPTIVNQSTSAIGYAIATLSADVRSNGLNTAVSFEYGTSTAYGQFATASPSNLYADTTEVSVVAQLNGLVPGTTYHFRVVATSAAGATYGNDEIFSTIALTNARAIVPLTVRDAGVDVGVLHFGYDTLATFCLDGDLGEGLVEEELFPVPVSGTFDARFVGHRTGSSCLGAGTAVHLQSAFATDTFRLKVQPSNAGLPVQVSWPGNLASDWMSLKIIDQVGGLFVDVNMLQDTLALVNHPVALTLDIIGTPVTSVMPFPPSVPELLSPLNGDTGLPTSVTFSWRGSPGATIYGIELALDSLFTSPVFQDTALTQTSTIVNGLIHSTEYWWRADARNSIGSSGWSGAWKFTIGATNAPVAKTLFASGITTTSARLHASIHPNGLMTTVVFEFGESASYGQTVIADESPLAAGISSPVTVSAPIDSLAPGTMYHFRVRVMNADGESFGSDSTFTTASEPSANRIVIPIYASENLGESDSVIVGYYPGATECIDGLLAPGLDEVGLPPSPPAGVFDFRTVSLRSSQTCLDQGLQFNFHSWELVDSSQLDTFRLALQNSCAAQLPIRLSWSREDVQLWFLSMRLFDPSVPTSVDMRIDSQYFVQEESVNLIVIARPTTLYTGIGGEANHLPSDFILGQNYPNPFNPITVISYRLPVTSDISLKIFNLLGEEIATLINERKEAGSYSVRFDGSEYPSGVYFYRLQAGAYTETRKLLLVR